jgi:hypothetical protein
LATLLEKVVPFATPITEPSVLPYYTLAMSFPCAIAFRWVARLRRERCQTIARHRQPREAGRLLATAGVSYAFRPDQRGVGRGHRGEPAATTAERLVYWEQLGKAGAPALPRLTCKNYGPNDGLLIS